MLISYSVENVYSFKESTTLDMKATSLKAHSYSLLEYDKYKLLPVVAIYGANASGKTNFIKGLNILVTAVSGKDISISSFALNSKENMNNVCIISIDFLINHNFNYHKYSYLSCKYIIWINPYNNKYVKEELYIKNLNSKISLLYGREWINDKWTLNLGTMKLAKEAKKEIEYVDEMEKYQNGLLLTVLGKRAQHLFFKNIYAWITKNINYHDIHTHQSSFSNYYENSELVMFYNQYKKELTSFIRSINPLIDDFSLLDVNNQQPLQDQQMKIPFFSYLATSNDFSKNIHITINESNGIWTALHLFPSLYSILQFGGILIIDEMENSLHPLLMANIINMFTSPETNPGKGQLIFTTHNALIMDKKFFRKDEIVFVEKDSSTGESILYRLFDIEGVRNDIDFNKSYIYGAFGALPQFHENEEDA